VIGIPLILEVISCTVIVRMIIMGNMFPDERREWWGRMGANVHRFMLIWMLVTSCVLVLPGIIGNLNFYKKYLEEVPAIVAAWGAVVAFAVKLAFGSSPKEETRNKKVWTLKDLFIRCAPYLFIFGFLLIGTAVYKQITGYIMHYIVRWNLIDQPENHNTLVYLLTTTVLLVVTLTLSWRVGVNEFSLHHFYRNRLVRS
jgi:Na+/melibiose symporter-like transporter